MKNFKDKLTIFLFMIMAILGMFEIFKSVIEICINLLKLIQ